LAGIARGFRREAAPSQVRAARTEDGGAAGGAAERTVKPAGGAYGDEADKNRNRRLEDAEASGSVLSANDAFALLGKSAGGREASDRRKTTPVLPTAPRRAGLRLPAAVASRVRGTRYAP
jgi:hypothetical protein